MQFDIVIPLGPNELPKFDQQIKYIKANVIGYRNIYIVSVDPTVSVEGCITIPEDTFSVDKKFIADHFGKYYGKSKRNGWYFQQLLKLYAGFDIVGILDDYLVIDSDVFFLKPTHFFEDGKYLFCYSNNFHQAYFEHLELLHPEFSKQMHKSGIAHHMFFNKNILREMMTKVEEQYNDGRPFWQIFIACVKEHYNYPPDFPDSGASEYEIYFNYMLKYHPDKIKIRDLNWCDKNHFYKLDDNNPNPDNRDYISICDWLYN